MSLGVAADFCGQVRQALNNIVEVLAEAEAQPEHIVWMNWFVPSKKEYTGAYKEIGAMYREIIGCHYPVMTAVDVFRPARRRSARRNGSHGSCPE
jgi:enamine deaminase RidA (YjgF/YER057c/UK114 family)